MKSIEETLQKLEAFYASYNEISTSVDGLHDQLDGFSASAISSEEVEYKKKDLQVHIHIHIYVVCCDWGSVKCINLVA